MAQSLPSSNASRPTICTLQQAFPIRDDEIRVVDLLPGSGFDAITLECRIINLNSGCGFEALSYVWGDLHAIRTVEISGYNVEITQTLYLAFRHLRNSQNKRTLWTDQVCINQGDDDEKSHQVRLMRTIYRKCSHCVIWLGDIPRDKQFSRLDAKVAMEFIHTMAYERGYLTEEDNCNTHTFISDNDHGRRARKAFEALIMGGNPWWSRVWTLQEASLPLAATLHWGPLTLPLETIELAALSLCQGWLCKILSNEVAAEYLQLTRNFLYPVRGLSIARAGETPLNLLMRWRYRKAADPRDKVYGFIGLLPLDSLSSIPALRDVNYSLTSITLFARVTLDLIRFDKDLRPLVGARELPHITHNLPTWVIDFASSSAIGKRQTKWWHHSHRYLCWTASKGLDLRLLASENDKTVFLSGILIDLVQKVSEVYHVSVEDEINDKKLRENIVQSRRILEEYQASCSSDFGADYVGGGTLKDAFWRTMVGNLIMGELPKGVPKNYHMNDFEDYVDKGTHSQLTLSLHGLVPNHAFFITKGGYMGIGPSDLRQGDNVCVFGGGRVPFVIRSQDSPPLEGLNAESRKYHLIGDAYVHGIMRGEAVTQNKEQSKAIELV
jgi:hypothetical protein